jgi:hypothetical protein
MLYESKLKIRYRVTKESNKKNTKMSFLIHPEVKTPGCIS